VQVIRIGLISIGYALIFPIATITKILLAQALYLLLR